MPVGKFYARDSLMTLCNPDNASCRFSYDPPVVPPNLDYTLLPSESSYKNLYPLINIAIYSE